MAESKHTPRVVDNDRDEITVTLAGKEIRGWSYGSEIERRMKMMAAREFVEGWLQAIDHYAAPDMLAALKDTIRMLEAVRYTAGLGKKQVERIEQAKAIAARAEGRQP